MTLPKLAKNQVFFGTFVHAKRLGELEILQNTAVCVDTSGKIVAVEANCNQQKAVETLYAGLGWSLEDISVTLCSDTQQFFFPGFVDTHVHASQYPNLGIFGKTTLLDWLNTYTFPTEASLAELPKARRVYTRCIRQALAHGTTTAAYYATIDVNATNLLADLCYSMGQRAFVGRVCMDHLGPDYYRDESVDQSMAATLATIEHIRSIDSNFELVSPILTPRFAPACSSETMKSLSEIQKQTQLPVQTHLSENVSEIELVKELFPDCKHYTDVYDTHGLLNEKTILAHAIHLTEEEADLIAERKAKIAHCPCSNSALSSGVARVRWLLEKGIQVGLGSDMSGGYSPSILEAARHAKLVSNHLIMPGGTLNNLSEEERNKTKLSVEEVLYLATKGGAEVVGLADKIGTFEVGKQWDAQLIWTGIVPDEIAYDDFTNYSATDIFGWETWDERVAKWVFNGDSRNVRKVWVAGRLVHEQLLRKEN
ncbi:guanine deaminase [Xylaria bambusicola]|uniref:guanine deaminase n=1 Tax=Xylaria bambusicola TaxID=326684 RepID=UPI00200875F9|nr:guanine deaminase [Xylaria bambusicola]KAI0514860.1 guanine deaminase [Xylaria bambusicola]